MPSLTQRGAGLTEGLNGIPDTTKWLAITALVALGILILLRHLFGSVRLEVGSK